MQTWDSNEEAHDQALGVFWGCSVKAYIITNVTLLIVDYNIPPQDPVLNPVPSLNSGPHIVGLTGGC